jgi:hypothetical protein
VREIFSRDMQLSLEAAKSCDGNLSRKHPQRPQNVAFVAFGIKCHAGVHLTVRIPHDGDHLELSWGAATPHGHSHGGGDLCFTPTAFQQARIMNMGYNPDDYQRLVEGRERREKYGQQG